jgi:sugar-specific transcriptional regulator TrmB
MKKIDLRPFNFDEKQSSVYYALLERGEVSVSELSQSSGIKRTTVYAALLALEKRGLVGTTRHKKRTLYFAEDPRALGDELEERQEKLQKVIPELLALSGRFTKKPRVRYYEGREGVVHVYRDTLLYPDQELCAWVSTRALEAFDADFLYHEYLPKRVEKKIWVRSIAPDTPEMQKYKQEDPQALRQTRLVPSSLFPFDVEIDLYGKRNVAILSFEEQFGMVIESDKLYQTLMSMFEMCWQFTQKQS